MATPLKFETAEPQDRSSAGEEARKRERCSSRVDWPVYPRLRHIVQRSERAQCGLRLAWSKTAENRREQQMLAMARALMGRPRLICMDEPTMGLSPLYVDKVLELIVEINREGITVFMVEQNANLALQIAHEGYVLQTGRIVSHGSAAALRDDLRIREAYLGSAAGA
jgi:ABC-type branched-subunit amino acid transport system ATPase component